MAESPPPPNARPGDLTSADNPTNPVTRKRYDGAPHIAWAIDLHGRAYLLDSASLGGDDHRTPLYRTPPVANPGGASADHGIWGALSSWEAMDGTRWVLAPVWGALNADLKATGLNGSTPNGSVIAFTVEEQEIG